MDTRITKIYDRSITDIRSYAAAHGMVIDTDYIADNGIIAADEKRKIDTIKMVPRIRRADISRVTILYRLLDGIKIIDDIRSAEQRKIDATAWMVSPQYDAMTSGPDPMLMVPGPHWTTDDITTYLTTLDVYKRMAHDMARKFADGFV